MMNIKLPFWMDKGELHKIALLFNRWWVLAKRLITMPLAILDEENCGERLLNLIAYSRDIERFPGEPLELYRKRVKYAFINAKDAGSKAGFIRIFARLGIGTVEIDERFDPVNWDVIRIRVSDRQLAENKELMNLIIRKYGRTCRRYTFEVISINTVTFIYGEFNHDYQCFHLKLN